MLNTLDWYLNCSWMSNYLSFADLNALSLTSKEVGAAADGARMVKVQKWSATACQGERVWIDHYKDHFPIIINPGSLYLKCLRYRHICLEHFREIVTHDPRLTDRQRSELIQQELATTPSKLFYWFVVNVLPNRPLKIHFSVELLRKTLELPYGQEVIRRTAMGPLHLFLNNRDEIVISNIRKWLVCVITKDSYLWPTQLWTNSFQEWFPKLCSETPQELLTNHSSSCPFCGYSIFNSCAHTMECMKSYVDWPVVKCRLQTIKLEA